MIPLEIIIYILKLLNDIEANISFKLINKIKINNFKNIEELLKKQKKNTVIVNTYNNEFYVYYYMKISENKFYRIIKVINNMYNSNEIIINICDSNLPLYNIPIDVIYS